MITAGNIRFNVRPHKWPSNCARFSVTFGLLSINDISVYAEGENELQICASDGFNTQKPIDMRVAHDLMHVNPQNTVAIIESNPKEGHFIHIIHPKDSLTPCYYSIPIEDKEAKRLLQGSRFKQTQKTVFECQYAGHDWHIHEFNLPNRDPFFVAEPLGEDVEKALISAPAWLGRNASRNTTLTDYAILRHTLLKGYKEPPLSFRQSLKKPTNYQRPLFP